VWSLGSIIPTLPGYAAGPIARDLTIATSQAKLREVGVKSHKFLFIPTLSQRLVPEYAAESNNCFTVSSALRFSAAVELRRTS
jgi:hypothetical protein